MSSNRSCVLLSIVLCHPGLGRSEEGGERKAPRFKSPDSTHPVVSCSRSSENAAQHVRAVPAPAVRAGAPAGALVALRRSRPLQPSRMPTTPATRTPVSSRAQRTLPVVQRRGGPLRGAPGAAGGDVRGAPRVRQGGALRELLRRRRQVDQERQRPEEESRQEEGESDPAQRRNPIDMLILLVSRYIPHLICTCMYVHTVVGTWIFFPFVWYGCEMWEYIFVQYIKKCTLRIDNSRVWRVFCLHWHRRRKQVSQFLLPAAFLSSLISHVSIEGCLFRRRTFSPLPSLFEEYFLKKNKNLKIYDKNKVWQIHRMVVRWTIRQK